MLDSTQEEKSLPDFIDMIAAVYKWKWKIMSDQEMEPEERWMVKEEDVVIAFGFSMSKAIANAMERKEREGNG